MKYIFLALFAWGGGGTLLFDLQFALQPCLCCEKSTTGCFKVGLFKRSLVPISSSLRVLFNALGGELNAPVVFEICGF